MVENSYINLRSSTFAIPFPSNTAEAMSVSINTISSPVLISSESKLKSNNIILVTKYDFHAELDSELSLNKGDLLKLVDKLDNGWILVKFIDKICKPGLIPSSYVDIVVNDPINPITIDWLQDKSINANFSQWEFKNFFKIVQPTTINNKPYPLSLSISNFYLYNERYWYRLDIVYSDHSKHHICRYYQDFYNLHISLLEIHLDKNLVSLPKLPEPIPLNLKDFDLVHLLLKRCNDLNVYMNKLILIKNFQIYLLLVNWLALEYNNLPGFKCDENDTKLSNEEITERILPNSVDILNPLTASEQRAGPEPKSESTPETIAAPKAETSKHDTSNSFALPKRTKSKNIFNHYHQIHNYSPKPQIKCKVLTPANTVLTIYLFKHQITCLQVFKTLIKQKIHFNFLMIRLPNQVDKVFHNIDTLDFNFLEFVNNNDKVLLKAN